MFITIINDCSDPNAQGRQLTRVASLFDVSPSFVSVSGTFDSVGELEAAGNLIDCLDASGGKEGIIIVNVAPRSGEGKHWPNGTPFGYFYHGETLVIASIAGLTLSLVKKLGLAQEITVLDLDASMDWATKEGLLDEEAAHRAKLSQFRSFDFVPRAALWLTQGKKLPSKPMLISEIPDVAGVVWFADNFGNCKTTILANEVKLDGKIETRFGTLPVYNRLKDVPNGKAALITGSSGIGHKRFLELVLQGGSATNKLGAKVGSIIFS